jgi:hypothetical protein
MNAVIKDFDTKYTDEVICPYCGFEYSDSWEFHDYHDKITCCECNKKFEFEACFDVTYCTYKLKESVDE